MPSSNSGSADKLSQKISSELISNHGFEIVDMESIELKRTEKLASLGKSLPKNTGHNIVEIPVDTRQIVEQFEPGRLSDRRGIRYSDVKKGISDEQAKRSSRFKISDLTRTPLSIEAEEEMRIEIEVEARLALKLGEIKEKTEKDAYAAGFEKGQNDGLAKVVELSKPKLDAFEAMLKSFEEMRPEVFRANEEYLIRMVYRLASMVVLKELKEDSEYIKRLVGQLFDRVGTKENVKIYLGSEEYSAAEQLKAGLAQSFGELKNVSIEVDSKISQGCRIETDFGEVDARLEVQMQNIAQALGVSVNENKVQQVLKESDSKEAKDSSDESHKPST